MSQEYDPFNLDSYLTSSEEIIEDAELLRVCLSYDTDTLIMQTFEKWSFAKDDDSQINWLRLPIQDRWRCFILESLICALQDIMDDEVMGSGETFDREIDWSKIFDLLKVILELIFSSSGNLLHGDDLYKLGLRYYKVVMNQWDISDDLEGVDNNEIQEVIAMLGGESDIHAILEGLLLQAYNYSAAMNVVDGSDDNGDDTFPRVMDPV